MNPKTGKWEKVSSFIPKDATSFVVPKLKEGEDYKFRVMAENDHGLSEPLVTDTATRAKNPYGELKIFYNDAIMKCIVKLKHICSRYEVLYIYKDLELFKVYMAYNIIYFC